MTTALSTDVLSPTILESNIPVGICYGLLRRSAKNMRTINPKNSKEDREMLASIRAKGLLQNLVVYPVGDIFEIPAGGRRMGCLEILHECGEIDDDYIVPCLMRTEDEATVLSLIENIQRKAPHPADVYSTFVQLMAEGQTVTDIAKTNGISEAQVNRNLRLGKVHKKLFKLFSADKLSLDQVMAFAATSDTKLQLAAFKAIGENLDARPNTIREQLLENRQSSESALARFVTLKAYKDAGGVIEQDLFTQTTVLCDLPLLMDLSGKKLQTEADAITGWKWVETSTEGAFLLNNYSRLPSVQLPVPDELSAQLNKLNDRLTAFDEMSADEWSDDLAAEEERLESEHSLLQDRIDNDYTGFAEEDQQFGGCVVTFNQQSGTTEVFRGLLTSDDLKAYQAKDTSAKTNEKIDTSDIKPVKALISARLVTDLGLYRRSIIRSAVAKSKNIAIDLLHFQLCLSILSKGNGRWCRILDMNTNRVSDDTSIDDYKKTAAAKELAESLGKLDIGWISLKTEAKQFEAFRALSAAKRHSLVAYCVASLLSSGNSVAGNDKLIDGLVEEMEINFQAFWRPTATNYFGRLTKALLVEQGKKWFGATWLKAHANDAKSSLVEHFEHLFSGSSKSLPEKEQTIAAEWLPKEINK